MKILAYRCPSTAPLASFSPSLSIDGRFITWLLCLFLVTATASAAPGADTPVTRPAASPTKVSVAKFTKSATAKATASKSPSKITAIRRMAPKKVMASLGASSKTAVMHCTGQVMGPNNQPLPGACVFLTGNHDCITVTDANGKFNLPLPTKGTSNTVTVTYGGLEDREVAVPAKNAPILLPMLVSLKW